MSSYVLAQWTSPSEPPPAGNIDLPLNASNIGQEKLGGLVLNSGSQPAPYGLIVAQGKMGIGTTEPTQQLHIAGNLRLTGHLFDVNNSSGSDNQVLTRTSSGPVWQNVSGGGGSFNVERGGEVDFSRNNGVGIEGWQNTTNGVVMVTWAVMVRNSIPINIEVKYPGGDWEVYTTSIWTSGDHFTSYGSLMLPPGGWMRMVRKSDHGAFNPDAGGKASWQKLF